MSARRNLLFAAAASLMACGSSTTAEQGDTATPSGSSGADASAPGLDAGASAIDAGTSGVDAGGDMTDAGEDATDVEDGPGDVGEDQADARQEPDGGEPALRCDDETHDVPGGFIDHADGSRTDVTERLRLGTPEAPVGLVLDDATLTICEGTYFAIVTATGTSSLEGKGAVTLDGAGTFRLVDQPEGGALTVRHVHLKDGAGDGGALRCVTGEGAQATLLVEDVEVSGGRGGQGAALWTSGCAVTFRDAHLHDNETTDSGGAIWATNGARVDLVDTRIRANVSAGPGGGMLLVGSSGSCRRTAEDTVAAIHANTASDGGQLYLHTSTMELVDCDLGANGSPEDGIPNDILTWDLVETRHYQASAAANATCTRGICGGQPTLWESSQSEWLAFPDVISGGVFGVAFAPTRTGRLAGMFARLRLTNEGNSCHARAVVQTRDQAMRGDLTLIQLTDTWVGVRGLDVDMRAGGPTVEFTVVFEQCDPGGARFRTRLTSPSELFGYWGGIRAWTGFVAPWQVAWTPEL